MGIVRWTTACFLSTTLATTLAAQRVWIVDVNNGPGTDFTRLGPALAVAGDGDTIRVRRGDYLEIGSIAITGRGLTLLGDNGVRFSGVLVFEDLPANRQVTIEGINGWPRIGMFFVLRNCAGRVVIDRVAAGDQNNIFQIYESRQVHLNQVSCAGLYTRGSVITLSDCVISGRSYASGQPSADGITAVVCDIEISRSTIRGGGNYLTGPTSNGIVFVGGTLRLHGDGLAQGGPPASAPGGAGIAATNADVHWDPLFQAVGTAGAPGIVFNNVRTVSRRLPALSVTGSPPGGAHQIDVLSPQGDIVAVFWSLVGTRLPSGDFGNIWLDLPSTLFFAAGLQGSSEHLSFRLSVPNDPSLTGLVAQLQAVSGDLTGFYWSNPGVHVID